MNGQEIQELKETPGKVRGVVFETDTNYILKKIGQDGVKKLQQKTKEFGWEIDYQNIRNMAWYPVGLRAVSLLAAQQAFGWGQEKIKEMGNAAPKHSFVAGMMMKYFVSIKRVFVEVPKYWQKHYTVGKLESLQIDENKKYGILQLKNFRIHPILCHYYLGYFLRIAQFAIKSKKITIEETECMFKGNESHQFLVRWD